jgi:hypothetical protein
MDMSVGAALEPEALGEGGMERGGGASLAGLRICKNNRVGEREREVGMLTPRRARYEGR